LICGNGGSAAEAQHFSAELVGRYLKDRKAFPAMSLSTDTSAITAIGNDYGFEKIFSRQVESLARSEDVIVCISTSGNSVNVIEAAKMAKKIGVKVVGLSGNDGGKLKSFCDINLVVPSSHTPYIQEVHLIIIHSICDLIDSSLIPL
jgi:D-sedoheptulose 7-phosphate isomerase